MSIDLDTQPQSKHTHSVLPTLCTLELIPRLQPEYYTVYISTHQDASVMYLSEILLLFIGSAWPLRGLR